MILKPNSPRWKENTKYDNDGTSRIKAAYRGSLASFIARQKIEHLNKLRIQVIDRRNLFEAMKRYAGEKYRNVSIFLYHNIIVYLFAVIMMMMMMTS